jgi:hypothetical protein
MIKEIDVVTRVGMMQRPAGIIKEIGERECDRESYVDKSFTEAAALADFVVSQRGQPEAFADNVRLHLKCVLGAGFEEPEEVFDNRGCRMVSFEIYKSFAVDGRRVDEGRFLRVVDEIARVDACLVSCVSS